MECSFTAIEMTTDPIFTLYVVWHPSNREGQELADLLRQHFGRSLNRRAGEERSLGALVRSQPVPNTATPPPIAWNDSKFTAVVALVEANLIEDRNWVDYVRDIAKAALERELPAGFFPVAMDGRALT